MIYCVRFSDVVDELAKHGFRETGRTGSTVIFDGPDPARLLLRAANTDGNLPEIIVNSAFDTAGVTPPKWDVFWCD